MTNVTNGRIGAGCRGAYRRWLFLFVGLCLGPAGLIAAPPNDDFASAEVISGASGLAVGTNRAATAEESEPRHAEQSAVCSVWWTWVAPANGGATFGTLGSGVEDTVLAVYVGDSLSELLRINENDDLDTDREIYQSQVSFEVTGGRSYHIAVDGYDGETGDLRLAWSSVVTASCDPIVAPTAEHPFVGADGIGLSVTLRWNSGRRAAAQKAIYGADDRRDVYEETDPDLVEAADSTVALVSRSDLQDNGDGTFTLPDETFGVSYELCANEPYRTQPNPASCSGYLVAPDLVVTAGHCVTLSEDCEDVAFVFGFRMLDAKTPALTIDASQIYFCRGIVGMELKDDGADWAVVRLDREVPDHSPLPIRRSGKIADGEPLVIIGHPAGLPTKIADGAVVRDNVRPDFFVANLDAYGGNSGSAVFHAETLVVEGILVRGEEDFVLRGDCFASFVAAKK